MRPFRYIVSDVQCSKHTDVEPYICSDALFPTHFPKARIGSAFRSTVIVRLFMQLPIWFGAVQKTRIPCTLGLPEGIANIPPIYIYIYIHWCVAHAFLVYFNVSSICPC